VADVGWKFRASCDIVVVRYFSWHVGIELLSCNRSDVILVILLCVLITCMSESWPSPKKRKLQGARDLRTSKANKKP
jgi:hypothetical protein